MRFFSDRGVYNSDQRFMNRLNERYNHIIQPQLNHIMGKKILDLGAHDGRWMWACLESGAKSATGFEARKAAVESGKKNIPSLYRDYKNSFDFRIGDVFDLISKIKPGKYDTILCLGLFYHILNHERIIELMTSLKPEAIIIDSVLFNSSEAISRYYYEETSNPDMGFSNNPTTLVGTTSVGALNEFAKINGYSIEYIEWRADQITYQYQLNDYMAKERFTCVLRPLYG